MKNAQRFSSIGIYIYIYLVMILMNIAPAMSQGWMPTLCNEKGDSIPYLYPIPDSCYEHNEIIIYFRPAALYLDKLCYQLYDQNKIGGKNSDNILSTISDFQLASIYSQRFPVDSLIADSSLLYDIKLLGGDTLRRITIASPCSDTIAIGKNGDTLKCHDYLMMVLHLNNDTSAINSAIALTYYHQNKIVGASLNFIYQSHRDPTYDAQYSSQLSLHGTDIPLPLSGFNYAWNHQVGRNDIRVSVIDFGVDYYNCDLIEDIVYGKKVVDNYFFAAPGSLIEDYPNLYDHGTQVAGIIGAYTNRSFCATASNGISGIAGGYGNNSPDLGAGCRLVSLNVHNNTSNYNITTDRAIAAIKASSAYYPGTPTIPVLRNRFISNIINCSWGVRDADPFLRDAVNYAYQFGVSFVASSGNTGLPGYVEYPATYDNSWVTKVGASNHHRARVFYSNFDFGLDFLAPGGDCIDENERIVISTEATDGGSVPNSFGCFDGTSAAAPHAAGLIALLRSEDLDGGIRARFETDPLEPEDYEGMIKASAFDIKDAQEPFGGTDNYLDGYDIYSGWGHLQADNLFDMLKQQNYRISHVKQEFDPDNFFKSEYQSDNFEFWNNAANINKSWFIPTDWYHVIPYEVSTTITLESGRWLVDDNHPLFVWGRGGRNGKYGLSFTKPVIYQSGYTSVYGDNIEGRGNSIVDSIYHSYSLDVQAATYQYHVWKIPELPGLPLDLGLKPPDNDLGVNITVFGVDLYSSVNEEVLKSQYFDAVIFPVPAKEKITIQIILKNPSFLSLTLYDYLGNKIKEKRMGKIYSGIQTFDFDLNNVPVGMYFMNISANGNSSTSKIIVGE